MNCKLRFVFLLLLIFIIAGCAKVEVRKLSEEEKIEDFDQLYSVLEKNYPYFDVEERKYGQNWLESREEYREQVLEADNLMGFYREIRNILGGLNKHTTVLSPELYNYMKEQYGDINSAEERNKNYEPWLEVLNRESVVDTYSFLEERMKVDDGEEVYFSKEEIEREIIEEGKLAYLKVPSFDSKRIEEDSDELYEFWREIEDYPNLIIDIRGNPGGSVSYWKNNIVAPLIEKPIEWSYFIAFRGGEYTEPFIRAHAEDLQPVDKLPSEKDYPPEVKENFQYFSEGRIRIEPDDSINFSGEIYLLVDQINYSAAETLCLFAKDTGWATLVGERTGGDGLGIDPVLLSLPNSGLVIRFPVSMGLNPDGKSNEEYGTVPDIESKNPREEVLDKIQISD